MNMQPWFGLLLAITGSLALWGMLTRHPRIPQWVHRHDKAMHFASFALLAALAQGTWPTATAWALWVCLSALGVVTEGLQHLLTHRHFCWRDAMANAMGAATVLGAVHWFG